MEEKEATLNKKSKQIQEISEEKGTLNGEIHDLKDMLEVKERKINVLQKKVHRQCCRYVDQTCAFDLKRVRLCCGLLWILCAAFTLQIENLQEQLRDKEKQMSSLKERVKSLQADTSNTDTALNTLEESLAEKVSACAATAASRRGGEGGRVTDDARLSPAGAHHRTPEGAAGQRRP